MHYVLSGNTLRKYRHDGDALQIANDNRENLFRAPNNWRRRLQLMAITALARAAGLPGDCRIIGLNQHGRTFIEQR
jgi:hypothetical protein